MGDVEEAFDHLDPVAEREVRQDPRLAEQIEHECAAPGERKHLGFR